MFKKILMVMAFLAAGATFGGAADNGGGNWNDPGQPGNTGIQGGLTGQMPGGGQMGVPGQQYPQMQGMGGQMPMGGVGQMPMGGVGQMPMGGVGQMPMGGGGQMPMGGGGQMPMGGGLTQMPMGGMGQMQFPNVTGRYMGQMVIAGRQFTVQAVLQQQGNQVGGQVAIPELGGQPMPIAMSMIQNGMLGLGFTGMGTGGMVSMVLSLMPSPTGLQGMAGDATTGQTGQIVLQRTQ